MIKINMDMPMTCEQCSFHDPINYYDRWCHAKNSEIYANSYVERDTDCPLIEEAPDGCIYLIKTLREWQQWRELKETIIEMRDNDGTGTQQDVCNFLANYMDVLETNVSGSEKPTGSELITKDDAINMIKELAEYHTGDSFNADRVIENIKRLPLVKPQEQKPNTWSLDDAREDFMYDVYKTLESLPTNDEANRIIDSFDRVTSGIRCDDAISRQQAIEKMQELEDEDIEAYGCAIPEGFDGERAIEALNALPSIQSKPKMGRWILSGGYWRCSECKEKALLKLDRATGGCREYTPIKSNHCPNCGRKMEVEK